VQIFRGLAISSCALLAWGCSVDAEPDSWTVISTSSSLMTKNDLSFNRLAFNRLAFNRLAFNRLAFNRLAFNRLAFNSLDGIEATPDGRDVLTYVARCALAEGDVLIATHEDVTYEFPGLLGLATQWENRGLTGGEARWVSACLIAHVNAFGVSVEISLRAPERIAATPEEAHAFPVYEATFFGDVFGEDALETYACIGSDAEIARVHAPDRALRVCADPGPECEVESLGYCRDVCDTYVHGVGWTGCWAGATRYAETVSTFLRSQDDVCQAVCSAGDFFCQLRCPGRSESKGPSDSFSGNRILDCNGTSGLCTATCRDGACLVDAAGTGMSYARVHDGATAEMECASADTCLAECRGKGTRCNVDCTGAGWCAIERCSQGAGCLLDCTGAGSCDIESCQGTLRACADDVLVCNRPCPEG
jgi:hypothetical protein